MDIKNLIPKHKSDLSSINKIKQLSFTELKPIIPELLSCIQDMHWDIANEIGPILEKHSYEITSEILEVLSGNDAIWKFNCLAVFEVRSKTLLDPKIFEKIISFSNYSGDDVELLDLKEISKEIIC